LDMMSDDCGRCFWLLERHSECVVLCYDAMQLRIVRAQSFEEFVVVRFFVLV